MAVNRAFHTNNVSALTVEQNLYRDLIKEAIQIYGHDVYYCLLYTSDAADE